MNNTTILLSMHCAPIPHRKFMKTALFIKLFITTASAPGGDYRLIVTCYPIISRLVLNCGIVESSQTPTYLPPAVPSIPHTHPHKTHTAIETNQTDKCTQPHSMYIRVYTQRRRWQWWRLVVSVCFRSGRSAQTGRARQHVPRPRTFRIIHVLLPPLKTHPRDIFQHNVLCRYINRPSRNRIGNYCGYVSKYATQSYDKIICVRLTNIHADKMVDTWFTFLDFYLIEAEAHVC